MADIFDPEPSIFLCDESKDLCFDDLDVDDVDGGAIDYHHDHDGDQFIHQQNDQSRSWSLANGSEPFIHFPPQSEEDFASMLEREFEYLPKHDYLTRLRCGVLDLARREAFDWIWKAYSYYSLGPLSFCLAVNYLDRFLSIRDLPRDKAWAVQLLAVACLSIAAKIEETLVPQSIDLQVGDPHFVFEAKTIQRMELLVLDTLNWKMNAITPCSFLDYFLKKLSDAAHNNINNSSLSITKGVNRSMQLILCTLEGIDFLEFKPSEIAAAVAISVSAESQALDIDKATSCFIHLEKAKIVKCIEMIKDKSVSSRNGNLGSISSGQGVQPQSPIGVLDSACFSYKSDELTTTVGSCAHINTTTTTTTITTTRTSSPETKRMKLDTTTSTSPGMDF